METCVCCNKYNKHQTTIRFSGHCTMGRDTERMEFVKSLVKLKEREEVIEKTIDNFIDGMKLEAELLNVVKNERRSRVLERRTFTNAFKKAATDVAYDLKEIKSAINDLQDGSKIDVDGFKNKLFGVASKIREFKDLGTQMETLTNEESELDRELNAFSIVLAKYETRNSRMAATIAHSKKYCKGREEEILENCQNYTGIRDFDALVVKTGHTQSWSPADHAFFVKLRKKCRSVPVIVAAIRKRCPDLSVECIVNHEAWYKIYLDLREKQRRSIKEWRDKRELEKREKAKNCDYSQDARIAYGNSGEKIDANFVNDDSIAKDNKNEISPIALKNSVKSAPYKRRGGVAESNKKELVKRWQIEREIARSIENENQKARLESRKAWKENRRLARAMKLREALAEYRQREMKNNENNESSTASTSLTPDSSNGTVAKARTATLIKSFRQQDEEYLKRRKAVMLEAKKSRRSSNVFVEHEALAVRLNVARACRDQESTLLKPTKGWLQKCKREESRTSIQSNAVSYVKDIPKLATRHWRNEESV